MRIDFPGFVIEIYLTVSRRAIPRLAVIVRRKMNILIISGFLGAGKTTFIKELIRRTHKNIVVMENEFGSASIDSGAVSGNGIDVLEFMEGCVCCTMKDSFINSVLTVSATLDP